MRIFQNLYECVKETQRDLHEMGLTVELKTFQNKDVSNDAQRNTTKEIIGYTFKVLDPFNEEALLKAYSLIFENSGESVSDIRHWVDEEFKERVSAKFINPGDAWKSRKELWEPLLNQKLEFDYTYHQRLNYQAQLVLIIEHLRRDKHSRRAVINIYLGPDQKDFSGDHWGLFDLLRVPCSVTYSFLIRNDKLEIFYHLRSSDFYAHFINDLVLTSMLQKFVVDRLKSTYPELIPGDLVVYINSLHAYKIDLDKRVIY